MSNKLPNGHPHARSMELQRLLDEAAGGLPSSADRQQPPVRTPSIARSNHRPARPVVPTDLPSSPEAAAAPVSVPQSADLGKPAAASEPPDAAEPAGALARAVDTAVQLPTQVDLRKPAVARAPLDAAEPASEPVISAEQPRPTVWSQPTRLVGLGTGRSDSGSGQPNAGTPLRQIGLPLSSAGRPQRIDMSRPNTVVTPSKLALSSKIRRRRHSHQQSTRAGKGRPLSLRPVGLPARRRGRLALAHRHPLPVPHVVVGRRVGGRAGLSRALNHVRRRLRKPAVISARSDLARRMFPSRAGNPRAGVMAVSTTLAARGSMTYARTSRMPTAGLGKTDPFTGVTPGSPSSYPIQQARAALLAADNAQSSKTVLRPPASGRRRSRSLVLAGAAAAAVVAIVAVTLIKRTAAPPQATPSSATISTVLVASTGADGRTTHVSMTAPVATVGGVLVAMVVGADGTTRQLVVVTPSTGAALPTASATSRSPAATTASPGSTRNTVGTSNAVGPGNTAPTPTSSAPVQVAGTSRVSATTAQTGAPTGTSKPAPSVGDTATVVLGTSKLTGWVILPNP